MIKYFDVDLGDAEIEYNSCFGGVCPLTKVAEVNLLDTIDQKKNCAYLHVIAMGAGDFYAENKNGDFFYEKDLRDYHHTFESAGIFVQHANKDPSETRGKVLKSIYNEDMHRVELVLEIRKSLAPEIYERIKGGERIAVSMGVKVPSESCSYCGKITKGSLANRCEHLKYRMHDTMENGQVVYAINGTPMNFFDISIVVKPADIQGHALFQKVASVEEIQTLEDKVATIIKYMDAIDSMPKVDDNEMEEFRDTFSPKMRIRLIRSKGIVLKPSEAMFMHGDMPKERLGDCRQHCDRASFVRALIAKALSGGGCGMQKEAQEEIEVSSAFLDKLKTRTFLVKEAVLQRGETDFYGNKRIARVARDTSKSAMDHSRYAAYKLQMMNGDTVGIPKNMLVGGPSGNPLKLLFGVKKIPDYYTDLVDDGYAQHIIGVLTSGDEKVVYKPKTVRI